MTSSISSINLRIIHSTPTASSHHGKEKDRDVITGSTKTDKELSFKCNIHHSETLLEEHWNLENNITLLRFRNLANPPPDLPWRAYTHVLTLHISCIFPARWMFSHLSSMPVLKCVNLGSGCFTDDPYTMKEIVKLEPALSVTDFTIRVDLQRYKDCADYIVKNRIGSILDCAQMCLKNLTTVNFSLPMEAEKYLNLFRGALPQFRRAGCETKDYNKNELVFKFSPPPPPPQPKTGQRSSSSSQSNSNVKHKSGHDHKAKAAVPPPPKKPKTLDVEVIDLEESDSDTDERVSDGEEEEVDQAKLNVTPAVEDELPATQPMSSLLTPPDDASQAAPTGQVQIKPGKVKVTFVTKLSPPESPASTVPTLYAQDPRLEKKRIAHPPPHNRIPPAKRPGVREQPTRAKIEGNKAPSQHRSSRPEKRESSPSLLQN